MADMDKIPDELRRTWDTFLAMENSILAQRKRHRELNEADAEQRAASPTQRRLT